jgi:hypothetical protein
MPSASSVLRNSVKHFDVGSKKIIPYGRRAILVHHFKQPIVVATRLSVNLDSHNDVAVGDSFC